MTGYLLSRRRLCGKGHGGTHSLDGSCPLAVGIGIGGINHSSGVTIIGIHHEGLQRCSGGSSALIDIHDDSAGSVAGQSYHIEAGAPEGKGCFTDGVAVYRDLLGRTHGILGHVLIVAVVTIDVVGIVGGVNVVDAGAVRILHRIGHGVACCDPLICVVFRQLSVGIYAVAIQIRSGKAFHRNEVILVIDGGSRNDGNRGIHVIHLHVALVIIVSDAGLVVEGHRLHKLHSHISVEGETHSILIFDGSLADLQHLAIIGFHIEIDAVLLLCGFKNAAVDFDSHRRTVQQAYNFGCQIIVCGYIDDHGQTKVYNHHIGLQLGLPQNSKRNGGIVEVEAGICGIVCGLIHDGISRIASLV